MKVRVFGPLRSVEGDSKETEVHVDGRCTALKLLDQVVTAYPGLQEDSFGEGDKLQGGVNLFVNGRSVRFLDSLSTLLEEDDELALFPPLGGGQVRREPERLAAIPQPLTALVLQDASPGLTR